MSSRAEQIRAAAGRIKQRHDAPDERPPSSAPAVRTERVRRTVDLSPVRHRKLAEWCTEAAEELGVARLTGQDVLSALVGRLLTDERLSRAIKQEIKESRNQ